MVRDCVQALEQGEFRASRLLEAIVLSYPFYAPKPEAVSRAMGVKIQATLAAHVPPRGRRRAGPAAARSDDARAAAAAAEPKSAAAPVRAAYLYFPNGAWMDAWVPKTDRHRLRTAVQPDAAGAGAGFGRRS